MYNHTKFFKEFDDNTYNKYKNSTKLIINSNINSINIDNIEPIQILSNKNPYPEKTIITIIDIKKNTININ
jgi:hypothetical protein